MNRKISLTILSVLLLITSIFISACSSPKTPEDPNAYNFAKCLTDSGAAMYGTEWCPHCKDQKALFGDDFKEYINYVDCDRHRDECVSAGVEGYPTWIINGSSYPGTKSLAFLSQKSGCPLNDISDDTLIKN